MKSPVMRGMGFSDFDKQSSYNNTFMGSINKVSNGWHDEDNISLCPQKGIAEEWNRRMPMEMTRQE